jgi:CheY-like chemotaxis protein
MKSAPFILVVDDEPVVAGSLVQILESEGYRAAAESDGLSAIQRAEQDHPDLLICDVIMPGVDGIEAARRIMKLCPRTRTILFSGRSAAGLLQHASDKGFRFDVMMKPVKPADLLGAIRRLLEIEPYARAV